MTHAVLGKYVIVTRLNQNELIEAVNEGLELGYHPIGGVFSCRAGWWHQSMLVNEVGTS